MNHGCWARMWLPSVSSIRANIQHPSGSEQGEKLWGEWRGRGPWSTLPCAAAPPCRAKKLGRKGRAGSRASLPGCMSRSDVSTRLNLVRVWSCFAKGTRSDAHSMCGGVYCWVGSFCPPPPVTVHLLFCCHMVKNRCHRKESRLPFSRVIKGVPPKQGVVWGGD